MSSYMVFLVSLIQWHDATILLLFSIGQTGRNLSACSKEDRNCTLCNIPALSVFVVLCSSGNVLFQHKPFC